jgi:Na+-transporting methylmalonyl-CoA/oxaloacetate decarboxylase gamma subunit
VNEMAMVDNSSGNLFMFLWLLIPLAGILGWVITSTVKIRARTAANDQIAAALAQSTETNRQLAERLEQLDRRLASVEKTLNDVG